MSHDFCLHHLNADCALCPPTSILAEERSWATLSCKPCASCDLTLLLLIVSHTFTLSLIGRLQAERRICVPGRDVVQCAHSGGQRCRGGLHEGVRLCTRKVPLLLLSSHIVDCRLLSSVSHYSLKPRLPGTRLDGGVWLAFGVTGSDARGLRASDPRATVCLGGKTPVRLAIRAASDIS